jgi:hypothetical protein
LKEATEQEMQHSNLKTMAVVLFNGGLLQYCGELYEATTQHDDISCTDCDLAHGMSCGFARLNDLCIKLDGLVCFTKTFIFKRYTGVLPPEKTIVTF